MFPLIILILLSIGKGIGISDNNDIDDSALEYYITMFNYPFENHTVVTDDGYYLTMARVPVDLNKTCDKVKGTIMIYHGMMNNGALFFYLGPEHALGFQLSNQCYDVWVPNTRGTKYSSRHAKLTPQDRAFWNFSYDELAIYDTKANIDYVLNATRESKIHFMGFSQATTQILMLLSELPQYGEHISSLHLVAPIAYFTNFTSYPKWLPVNTLYTLTKEGSDLFARAVPDDDYLFQSLLYSICYPAENRKLCFTLFMSLRKELNHSESEALQWLKNYPERISLKMMAHFAQIYMSGKFQKYEYGPEQNLIKYGTETTPLYSIESFSTPTYLYQAASDIFSKEAGVKKLVKRLTNLRKKHLMLDPTWGHDDFWKTFKNTTSFFQLLFDDLNENE